MRLTGFVWYELMTTDTSAAANFYADVLGWGVRNAATAQFDYTLFSSGDSAVCGLMDLPDAARKMGATPRWAGYVAVDDISAAVARLREAGGSVYVPPTDSNLGRISIVADPQGASLALVEGMKLADGGARRLSEPGFAGWHELFADNARPAFSFYRRMFGWHDAGEHVGGEDYLLFSVEGTVLGGILRKPAEAPTPFWLFYFNVTDVDAAMVRVVSRGGQIFDQPQALPGGNWVVRCVDPQGALFALQGPRDADKATISWSSNWGDFSSRGRLVKPRGT